MAPVKPVTYRITAPEPAFSGEVGGLMFAKGVYEGEVPDGPLAYFTSQGYGVEEQGKPSRSSKPDADAKAAADAAQAQADADAKKAADDAAAAQAQADADAKAAADAAAKTTGSK